MASVTTSQYHYGLAISTPLSADRPVPRTLQEQAAWDGKDIGDVTLQGSRTIHLWSSDVFVYDDIIQPMVVYSAHKYGSPLMYVGLEKGETYSTPMSWDDTVYPSMKYVFPLKFTNSVSYVEIDVKLRALFVIGRMLYDKWIKGTLDDKRWETEWLLCIAGMWHDLRRGNIAPGRFVLQGSTLVANSISYGEYHVGSDGCPSSDVTATMVRGIHSAALQGSPLRADMDAGVAQLTSTPTATLPLPQIRGIIPTFYHIPAGVALPETVNPQKSTLPVYTSPTGAVWEKGYPLDVFQPPSYRTYCAHPDCDHAWSIHEGKWSKSGRHWNVGHNDFLRIALCPFNRENELCRQNTKIPSRVTEYNQHSHLQGSHKDLGYEVVGVVKRGMRTVNERCVDRAIKWPCVIVHNDNPVQSTTPGYRPPYGLTTLAREPYDPREDKCTINIFDGLLITQTKESINKDLEGGFGDVIDEVIKNLEVWTQPLDCVRRCVETVKYRLLKKDPRLVIDPKQIRVPTPLVGVKRKTPAVNEPRVTPAASLGSDVIMIESSDAEDTPAKSPKMDESTTEPQGTTTSTTESTTTIQHVRVASTLRTQLLQSTSPTGSTTVTDFTLTTERIVQQVTTQLTPQPNTLGAAPISRGVNGRSGAARRRRKKQAEQAKVLKAQAGMSETVTDPNQGTQVAEELATPVTGHAETELNLPNSASQMNLSSLGAVADTRSVAPGTSTSLVPTVAPLGLPEHPVKACSSPTDIRPREYVRSREHVRHTEHRRPTENRGHTEHRRPIEHGRHTEYGRHKEHKRSRENKRPEYTSRRSPTRGSSPDRRFSPIHKPRHERKVRSPKRAVGRRSPVGRSGSLPRRLRPTVRREITIRPFSYDEQKESPSRLKERRKRREGHKFTVTPSDADFQLRVSDPSTHKTTSDTIVVLDTTDVSTAPELDVPAVQVEDADDDSLDRTRSITEIEDDEEEEAKLRTNVVKERPWNLR